MLLLTNSILYMEKKYKRERKMENKVVKTEANLFDKMNKFEIFKNEVENELKKFNLIITSENEDIARKERAEINKIKGKYNRERLDINKNVNAAYKIIDGIIDKKLSEYDNALLQVEEERKALQKEEIEAYYKTLNTDIDLDEIFEERWLNKTIDWKGEIAKALIEYRAVVVEAVSEEVAYILGDETRVEVEVVTVTTLKIFDANEQQLKMITDLLKTLKVEYTVE